MDQRIQAIKHPTELIMQIAMVAIRYKVADLVFWVAQIICIYHRYRRHV